MISPDHVRLMAQYNRWQNRSLYGAANTLDEAARRADRGAFFKSIHTTLAHILWGDEAWMSRLAGRPFPDGKGLEADYLETRDWETLNRDRAAFDAWLIDWAAGLTAADIEPDLHWTSSTGKGRFVTPRWVCLTHLFNHQTHHRGQVHAMLTAAGARPEDTDIPFMPDAPWK
ncbi:DinB family protein [Maricaulis sp.]|uniref:DinB family protein n=1 Tax=Maricaulis sp. TaxID=1486257 RepID=UPI00329A537F